jgi:hypothetical protein
MLQKACEPELHREAANGTAVILRQRPPRGLDNGSVTAGKHNDYLSLDDEINKTPKVRR